MPLRELIAAALLAGLSLSACAPEKASVAPEAGAAVDAPSLVRRLSPDPTDPLLAYSWDGFPETPAVFTTPVIDLVWGEASPHPDTLLYLPLNEGGGEILHDVTAPDRRGARRSGIWIEGRFGNALRISGAKGGPRVPLGRPSPFGRAWTLELWVRPWSVHDVLLAVPGTLELSADGHGFARVRLRIGGERFTVRAKQPLAPSEWNYVAVAYDARQLHHVRLVTNRSYSVRFLPEAARLDRGADFLALGPLGASSWPWRRPVVDIDDVRLTARAVPTAELLARAAARPRPGEHRLHLRFAAGSREERPWAGISRRPFLVSAADWQHGELHQMLVEGDTLRWVPAAWEADPRPAPFLPRTAHPVLAVGQGKVLVFGGEVRDSHLPPGINTQETYLYDVRTRTWEQVASATAPSPRCHQPMAYSSDQRIALLFGGWYNQLPDSRRLADTWLFDRTRLAWKERHPAGSPPWAMSDTPVAYYPKIGRFLLFSRRRLFEYDALVDRWWRRPPWTVVDARGEPAEPMPGAAMLAFDPRADRFLAFGGVTDEEGLERYSDRTAVFDHAANRWTVLELQRAPPARVRGGLAYDSARGRFVLFGGVLDQRSRRFGDLWTFRLGDSGWRRVQASNPPSARGGYEGMAYVPEEDLFVLPAGRHSFEEFLNEVWRLRFDDDGPGVATYAFDRRAFPDRSALEVRWLGGARSRLELALAISGDGLVWGPWLSPTEAVSQPPTRFLKVRVRLFAAAEPLPRLLGLGFPPSHTAAPPDVRRLRVELPPLPPGRPGSDPTERQPSAAP